jgi:hypothetical protein
MPIESHRTTQTGKTNEKYKRRRERKILVEKMGQPGKKYEENTQEANKPRDRRPT